MAMIVSNNLPALAALNTLGSNDQRRAKDMAKLSTGSRINNAGDDASGYSISQRMKAQLRSLEKCDDNVHTGYNMLKTAAEAVQCQTEILKKMREITLKASDDTYSQKDRDVLAIEADELFNQLDAIAEETNYNGMTLLNHKVGATMDIINKSTSTVFEPFDPKTPSSPNTNIGSLFTDTRLSTTTVTRWNSYGENDMQAKQTSASPPYVTLDFNNALAGHTIEDFNLQGFSIMCTGCNQFVSVVFSTDRPLGSGECQPSTDTSTALKQCRQYIIGIGGAKNAQDLANAVYDGMVSANRTTPFSSTSPLTVIGKHNLEVKRTGNTVSLGYPSTSSPYPLFFEGTKGVSSDVETTVHATAVEGFYPWEDKHIQSGTRATDQTTIRLWNTSLDALFPRSDTTFLLEPAKYPTSYDSADYPDPKEYPERYEGYVGTDEEKKQQLWRDTTWHLTKKGADQSGECLRTRKGAEKFLNDLDQAIKYTLHVSTELGSQMMRMEISSDNIILSHENVMSSESTLTDADMAKEMMNFARDNLLVSSSQAMLAQANQSGSNVLTLLQ